MENEYKTSDMGTAVILSYFDFPLIRIEQDPEKPQRKLFVFENSQKLQDLINSYWNRKTEVEPQKYFMVLKDLKTRLYM